MREEPKPRGSSKLLAVKAYSRERGPAKAREKPKPHGSSKAVSAGSGERGPARSEGPTDKDNDQKVRSPGASGLSTVLKEKGPGTTATNASPLPAPLHGGDAGEGSVLDMEELREGLLGLINKRGSLKSC